MKFVMSGYAAVTMSPPLKYSQALPLHSGPSVGGGGGGRIARWGGGGAHYREDSFINGLTLEEFAWQK